MNNFTLITIIAALASVGVTFRPEEPKKPRKCRLRDCQRMTTHNGGYCSAAHCKQDRERNRPNAGTERPPTQTP